MTLFLVTQPQDSPADRGGHRESTLQAVSDAEDLVSQPLRLGGCELESVHIPR